MLSPQAHNIVMNLLQGMAFLGGFMCVGGPIVLATLFVENQAVRTACGMTGSLVGLAAAIAGVVFVGRWFRRRVPARCPRCADRAYATTEGRTTRFRCNRCGPLDWPVFHEGR